MPLLTESAAQDRLRQLITDIKKEMGTDFTGTYSGPDDALARHLGIKVVEHPLGDMDEGDYIPRKPPLMTRPKIIINSSISSQERKNFTFFHEISHHIIREDDELNSFLNEFAVDNAHDKALENFCNIGAAEFLIPRAAVFDAISSKGFSIQLIEVLHERFNASLPATSIQLAQCAFHPCMVVLCEYGQVTLTPHSHLGFTGRSSECLHVLYASASPSFNYPSGRYIPVPNNHILMSAFIDQCMLKGEDTFLFKSGKVWRVECEALYYRGRVFGLFNEKAPAQVSLHQLALL